MASAPMGRHTTLFAVRGDLDPLVWQGSSWRRRAFLDLDLTPNLHSRD